jgi:hypothetical protein
MEYRSSRGATHKVSGRGSAYSLAQLERNQKRAIKRQHCLRLKRIDNLEKGKTVKVRVASKNLPNTMLPHEDGCMRVVQQVPREVRNFLPRLAQQPSHVSVSVLKCPDQVKQEAPERISTPHLRSTVAASHVDVSSRVGTHKGLTRSCTRHQHVIVGAPTSRGSHCGTTNQLSGIHKDVGIDKKHYRPSIAWYKASRSATSTNVPPLRYLGNGGRLDVFSATGKGHAEPFRPTRTSCVADAPPRA